jgi:hypothetical protein
VTQAQSQEWFDASCPCSIGTIEPFSVPQNNPSSYIKISAFLTTLGCGPLMLPVFADVMGLIGIRASKMRNSQGICP